MNREQYERLQAVFEEARELAGAARDEFLDRTCAGDETLRCNVEQLLAEDGSGEGAALETHFGLGHELLADAVEEERARASTARSRSLPVQIGHYRIREKIAEGGMGAVYLAEQDHPRRPVALKVIRPGVFSEELLRRFEFEAELLGRLQHPGIAQIYEAGEADTEAGRQPYFAMEYVDGLELGRYAADHDLDTEPRLELLARVCDAVHHAHQKGIIHRDLKPGNILVAPAPTASSKTTTTRFALLGQPKILDFGVSRLAHEGQSDATQLTQAGHVLGTPAYMSPEQAGGETTLDTRSDVYALGVIAFELLSGHLPHELGSLPLVQALQIVQQKPAPSLGTTDVRFRGDLSVIIGKALESDPERRYASAAALADDLRRYLADQPITARPPTLGYLVRRFVRRNTALVVAGLVALLCLVGGLILALASQREEARQRAVAEQQTQEARRAAYVARMQAAMAYAVSGDREAARRLLASTRPAPRGWEWEYLAASLQDDVYHFPMTARPWPRVHAMPGARALLFAIDLTTLRLFDFESRTWTDHRYPGLRLERGCLALLPNRRAAVWMDERGKVRRLELDGTKAIRPVCELGEEARHMCLAADGSRAVAATRAGSPPRGGLQLVDLASGRILRSARDLPDIWDVAMSPDGSRIATAMGDERTVRIWDAATLECTQVLRPDAGRIIQVCFSPTGRYLAASGYDRTICIWSLPAGEQKRVLGPVQHWADALAFAGRDNALVTGHAEARTRRWNIETGACESLTSGRPTSEPHENTVLQLGFSGEDLVLALSPEGIHVRLLRELFPSVLHHAPDYYSYAYDVDFSPSGRVLASSSWQGFVRLWDAATGRAITALACPGQVFWARYSDDGRRLLVSFHRRHAQHTVWLVDAVTLRPIGELEISAERPCGRFVRQAKAIVVGVGDGLWILDPVTLTVRKKRHEPAEVRALALSPDGTQLAYGLANGRLTVLDAATFEPLRQVQAHRGGIGALAYSSDGRRLASGGADEEIRIRDPRSGAELLRISSPGSQELFSLCFSRDGTRIFAGSRRDSIGVWDTDSGQELLRLHGHSAYVHGLALSPDGRTLASASGDNTVRLWDARPVAERLAARDGLLAAERAVQGRVERCFQELGALDKVLAAIDADIELGPLEKHAASIVAHRLRPRQSR